MPPSRVNPYAVLQPHLRLIQGIIVFGVLLAAWYGLTIWAYHFFRTVFVVSGKKVDYILLMSAWFIPWGTWFICKNHVSSFASFPEEQRIKEHAAKGSLPGRVTIGIALVLLLLAIAFSIQKKLMFYMDWVDAGPRLASAQAFLTGHVPFRDFAIPYGIFQEVVRPLIAFKLWGRTYEAYERMGSWLAALGAVFIFTLVVQTSKRKGWAICVGLIMLCRSDWGVTDRVFAAPLAVLLLCRAFATGNAAWAVGSGVVAFACLEYSLEIGLTLLAGCGAYFLAAWTASHTPSTRQTVLNTRFLKSWYAGILSAGLCFLIWVTIIGGLPAYASDLFHQLMYRGGSWSDTLPSHFWGYPFLPHRQPWKTYVYIHQVPVLSLMCVSYLFLKPHFDSPRWHQALLLACVVFFQFFIYIGRSDYTHWLHATSLVLPLAAMALEELIDGVRIPTGLSWGSRGAWAVLAGLVAIPFFSALGGQNALQIPYWAPPVMRSRVDGPHMPERWGSAAGRPADLKRIANAVSQIQAKVPANKTIYDFTNQGGYYFLADRQNSTRFGMIDELLDPWARRQFFQNIKAHPPAAVLASYHGGQLDCPLPGLESICDYIRSNFVSPKEDTQSTLRVLLPKGNTSL